MVPPAWRRSPEAAASSKVCPAGAFTGHPHGVSHPTAAEKPQPTVTIRHAPDPARHAATTTHPMTPSRSTTTATATNCPSDVPLFENLTGQHRQHLGNRSSLLAHHPPRTPGTTVVCLHACSHHPAMPDTSTTGAATPQPEHRDQR